jgi:hypothetical protein
MVLICYCLQEKRDLCYFSVARIIHMEMLYNVVSVLNSERIAT